MCGRLQYQLFPAGRSIMPMVKMVEYDDAPPEVKAVYGDSMATRN
jgi:hypothetical protein